MIDLRDLSIYYKHKEQNVPVLEHVSLHIGEGEFVAITGASGCGKTTLLHVLAGVHTLYTGSALINGEAPDPGRYSIGLVPQQYGLLPWKTVEHNILLPLQIRRQPVDERQLSEIASMLGLRELLNRFPLELSGGQRQRVALARVFLQRPQLLLLDEPFSALDLPTAERSRQLFTLLRESYRVTTIMVSHNIEEAAAMAERVILFGGSPGRLIRQFHAPDAGEIDQALRAASCQ